MQHITYISPAYHKLCQLRQSYLKLECVIYRDKNSTQHHMPTVARNCYVRQYTPCNGFLWASFRSACTGSPASIRHTNVHVRLTSKHARTIHGSVCRMVQFVPDFAQYTSCVKLAPEAYLFAHAVSKCTVIYCIPTNLSSTCLLVFEHVTVCIPDTLILPISAYLCMQPLSEH
jgi:hypothetical protein